MSLALLLFLVLEFPLSEYTIHLHVQAETSVQNVYKLNFC